MTAVDMHAPESKPDDLATFWTQALSALCAVLQSGSNGLSSADVDARLAQYGPNSDARMKHDSVARAILRRLLEPLSLIPLVAGIVSVTTGDGIGGSIIVAILAISIGLDTAQEGHAVKALDATACTVGEAALTGRATVFGAAASTLLEAQEPSPVQRDLHQFGLIIARLTLGLVVVVLATRVLRGHEVLDSLLFAVALAVGLTPELLPMITTVTLSHGAMRMARKKVIVKRLTLPAIVARSTRRSSMVRLAHRKAGPWPAGTYSILLGASDRHWRRDRRAPC